MYLLLSGGGFDSMSVLSVYAESIGLVLSIDYGQKAFSGEEFVSKYFADKYKIPHLSVKSVDLSQLLVNPILKGCKGGEVIDGRWEEKFEGDRLEARNLMLLSHAVMIACGKGLSGIMTGFHKESTNKFMDALPEFYESFRQVVKLATNYPLQFRAPFQELGFGRVETLLAGLKKDEEVWWAYTCYGQLEGRKSLFEYKSCGLCVHCYKRYEVVIELRLRGYEGPLPLENIGHIDHRFS